MVGSHVGGTELVDKTFGVARLLDDSFLVILTDGSAQFVVVHRRAILSLSPEFSNACGVLNLKDSYKFFGKVKKLIFI